MYAQTRQATEHHRDLLARAREQRRASSVVALRKASRRVMRAERVKNKYTNKKKKSKKFH
jgi:hypothetical protein